MPLYQHVYVERREAEGWVVPQDFSPEPWTFECDRPFGGFAWVPPRCGWLDLFFGADAVFPMRPGAPEDRRGSPLLRHLDRYYDYGRNEDRLCWLPYAELLVDCWQTDLITVGARVPARYAVLFGDGTHAFPNDALIEAGASERELEDLCQFAGKPVREAMDAGYGRHRHRIVHMPPEAFVEVTWRATIAEFVGHYAVLFEGLRRYGRDEDLRVLSRRG